MTTPQLVAIVEVEKADRVYCGQPGCNHTVYKAIHVVRDEGRLIVLGSTCFAKRYGSLAALGPAQFFGNRGRALSNEERALLLENTQALLDRFAEEQTQLRAQMESKLGALKEGLARTSAAPLATDNVRLRPPWMRKTLPWAWAQPLSSVAAFKMIDGSGWVRVEHLDGRQFIMPWPTFDGWDEVWPAVVGRPDLSVGGYESRSITDTVAYLRAHALQVKITGLWGEALSVLTPETDDD